MTSPDPTDPARPNPWFTANGSIPAPPGAENHDEKHEPINPTDLDDLQRVLQGLRKL